MGCRLLNASFFVYQKSFLSQRTARTPLYRVETQIIETVVTKKFYFVNIQEDESFLFATDSEQAKLKVSLFFTSIY